MELTSEQIISELNEYFKKRPEVILVYLFGSVARKEEGVLSDIDVGVLIDPGKKIIEGSYGYKADVTADLMSLLKSNAIEIVLLNSAPPLLAHRVVRDGVVVHCKDEEVRIAFEVRTLQRFIDTKPLRQIQNMYLKQRILG